MADSILRLKVESQEYEAKLKRASQGLNHFISDCRNSGKELNKATDDVLDYVRALGQMPTVAKGGQQSLREMTRTVGDLTIMYRELTEEEKRSPFGQALAQGIQELTKRAGDARDAIDDVNTTIKYAASDTKTFDTLTSSARLMAAGFQVVQGAAKLMGVDMSDNIELQTKLQSAMSVSIGLLQAQNLLQKESAVVQGVDAIKTQANAIAKALLAKNTAAATVAGEAFNAVAKANPYVLIASAAAAAIIAIVSYTRHSQKAAEADKVRAEEADRLRKKQEQMSSAIGTHVGEAEAKYRALQHEWNRLTTVSEKTDFIDKQSQSFKDLGLNITSVADAQKALVDMAPDVIAALRAVATAEAYSDLYKQSIQKRATEWENRVRGVETGDDYIREEVNAKKNWSIIPDEWTAAGLTREDYNMETMYFMNTMKTMYTLNQAGVDKINQYRSDQAKILNEKLKQQYDDEVSYYENKWTEAENNAIAAQGKIGKLLAGKTVSPTTTDAQTPTYPLGSLPQLTQQLKDLKTAQELALDPRQWAQYQQKIEQTQYMIDAFKGKWKEGLQAQVSFDTSVGEEQLRLMTDAGRKMLEMFGDGNVDLLARPMVQASELVKKGWEDAGDGIATVYSYQRQVIDQNGNPVEILVTPILPDGSILSENELNTYIDREVNGAADLLQADRLGIIIKVGVSDDGSAGEFLHQLQSAYYLCDEGMDVNMDTTQVKAATDNLGQFLRLADAARDIEGLNINQENMTITVDTVEAYQKLRQIVTDFENKNITFTVTPQVAPATATNLHNSAGLNAYINGLRQELQNADFGTVLYENLTSKLADANMLKNLLEQSLSVGLGTALFDTTDELGQTFWDRVLSPAGVADADWEAIAAAINEKLEELGLNPITIDVNTGRVSGSGKSTADNGDVWEHTEEIVSGMSQVSSGLDRMGIELPQAIQDDVNTMQGMIQTINGIQTIAHGLGTTAPALIQAAATGVQSAIALLIQALNINTASNSAAATSNVAKTAIDIMMAHGGVVPRAASGYTVPGTHYSGDVTPVLANAGEVILTRAQAGNLVSQLPSDQTQSSSSRPYVSGQDIFLGTNNYLKGIGQGGLVTTRFLQQRGLI
ncbi:MAG: hypothetical protein IKB00_06025 [Bacteroidaceae bacterium]|nr:hypothetical protein [Bacteroidaceae bacterium]